MAEHILRNADELVFARLACSKLAGMLQGVLSIGLQSLVSGVPEPKEWFSYRFHPLSALAVVLDTVAFKDLASETSYQLRQYSSELETALHQLQEESISVVPLLPDTTPQTLLKLRAAMIKVYDLLQACATLLALDLPEISKSRERSFLILDWLPATARDYKALPAGHEKE